MPDLGKYADTVLWSYAVSVVLLVALVAATVWKGRKARRALDEIENRRSRNG